jgi:hypothetical protein
VGSKKILQAPGFFLGGQEMGGEAEPVLVPVPVPCWRIALGQELRYIFLSQYEER